MRRKRTPTHNATGWVGRNNREAEHVIQEELLRSLIGLPWDWLMRLPIPESFSHFDNPEWNRWGWMREIEVADATRYFRWVMFTPRPHTGSASEWFVLAGGLSSGEWRYWSLRWAAMNDSPESSGQIEWWPGHQKSLGAIVERLFKDQFVDLHLRFGSTAYWPLRKLEVDDNGMPLDRALRKTLETTKRPKPKRRRRIRWGSLL
jgi:hypothetical protein